jgi:VWFA-related protein
MVDVGVFNRNVPVRGLTAEDFEVLDNGVPQVITAVPVEELPLDVTIVLELNDPGTELRDGGGTLWQPAQALNDSKRLAGVLGPSDRLRVLVTTGTSVFQPVALQPSPDALQQGLRIPAPSMLITSRLFDATAAALMVNPTADRRNVVLIFTDGIDGGSVLTETTVRAVAERSEAVCYVARRLTTGEQFQQRNPRQVVNQLELRRMLNPIAPTEIEDIASTTGGSARNPRSDESVASFFEQALGEFRQRYLFSYSPTGVPDPGWHTITVRMKKHTGYKVTARRGYFAGS